MDCNRIWRADQQRRPAMDANWQASLGQEARHKIVKRIMDTLQKHMPHSPDGMNKLMKIAWRFEEKIFQSAVDQQDYLRRISVKMLSLESKSQSGLQNPQSQGDQQAGGLGQQQQLPPQQQQEQMQHMPQQQVPQQQMPQAQMAQQMPQQIPQQLQFIKLQQQQQQQQQHQKMLQQHQKMMQQQQQQQQPMLQPPIQQQQIQQQQQQQQQQQVMSQLQQSQQSTMQQSAMQQQQQQQPYMQVQQAHTAQQNQSGAPGLYQQPFIPQPKQGPPALSTRSFFISLFSASVDSGQTAQSADEHEMVWQKLQGLKEKYLPDMNGLYQMLVSRSQQQQMQPDHLNKLNHYKEVLGRMIPYLNATKQGLPREFTQDKLDAFEKQIANIMDTLKLDYLSLLLKNP